MSPSGPFLHVGFIKKFAVKDKVYYQNHELLQQAVQNSLFIPQGHVLMPVMPNLMDNDNAKYHIAHEWKPELFAWDLAVKAFHRIYERKFRNCVPLSFDEAIFVAEKNTSSGYLFKMMGLPKKGDVIQKAYDLLKSLYDKICTGRQVLTIFEMAPKVEIRAIEKLINKDPTKCKQRTFVVGDVLFYLIGLSLYQNQNDAVIEDCYSSKSWNAVGMSIFYGGWDTLANILLSVNKNMICTDETAMESCLTGPIMSVIYNLRNQNYNQGPNYYASQWYFANLCFGQVLDHRGKLFTKVFQNPSGQPNTLLDNGFGKELKLLYHLAKSCTSVSQLVEQHDTLHLKYCGDDDIIPVHKAWDGLLQSSQEIGFNTKFEFENLPLHQCRFLNFGFSYNPFQYQWMFVPEYHKLFTGLYFYKKQNSWRLTLARLFAMRLLCYTDQEKYNTVEKHINWILSQPSLFLNERHLDDTLSVKSLMGQNLSEIEIRALLFNSE